METHGFKVGGPERKFEGSALAAEEGFSAEVSVPDGAGGCRGNIERGKGNDEADIPLAAFALSGVTPLAVP